MKRAPISKSLRFEVFAGDAYTCRYCGRQPDEVKLVIDHVIAVANGGTSERDNLVTSCEDCNAGKGTKDAKPTENSDMARMARLQALKEQEEMAIAAINAVKAKNTFTQVVVNAWCEITGRKGVDTSTIKVICHYVEEFGMEEVIKWIGKGHAKAGHSDRDMGRYISGIRRHYIEERDDP